MPETDYDEAKKKGVVPFGKGKTAQGPNFKPGMPKAGDKKPNFMTKNKGGMKGKK